MLQSTRRSKPYDPRSDLLDDGHEVPVCAGLSLARLLGQRQTPTPRKDRRHDDADKYGTHSFPPFFSSSASRDPTVPKMTRRLDCPLSVRVPGSSDGRTPSAA